MHRTAGPWTPTIHRLLDRLAVRGVHWLPRALGLDEQGREVLTYLPWTVPSHPMPSWVWSDIWRCICRGRLSQLRELHEPISSQPSLTASSPCWRTSAGRESGRATSL